MLGKTDAGYSITLQSTVIYFVLLFVWPDAAAADSSKVRATDGDHFWKAEINCADTRSCGTDALSTNLHTMTPIADSVDPGWVFTGIESHKVMSLECPAGRAIIIDCEGKFSAQLQTPQGSELCNFRLFEGQCNYDVQVDEISQLSDSMIVHTKFGDIRVQGTQFLVEVEPDGANIAVFGGEVRTGWVNQSSLMTGGKTRVLGANASIKEGVVSDADIRRAASLMSSADAERPPGNAPRGWKRDIRNYSGGMTITRRGWSLSLKRRRGRNSGTVPVTRKRQTRGAMQVRGRKPATYGPKMKASRKQNAPSTRGLR